MPLVNRLRWHAIVVLLIASTAVAQQDPGATAVGVVDQAQLIDASSVGGGQLLVIHLETGEAFRFPHADHVAAGSGVQVRIRYREATGEEELPAACSAEVLALPLAGDSGDGLQAVRRPFEVYRNPDCEGEA